MTDKGIAKPPKWLPNNMHYETMMGSVAYGVSSDTSDMDVYGICIPPKDEIFPHLRGEIQGFGNNKHRFSQYQQHHLSDGERDYDFCIYNIVDYFQLCMKNNPNMIDSMFTPDFCILHITRIGQIIRENRKLFLHKGSWHTYKGYAYQQVNKISRSREEVLDIRKFEKDNGISHLTKFVELEEAMKKGKFQNLTDDKLRTYYEMYKSGMDKSKRFELRKCHSMDIKFAYHVVRLLNEVEQIMTEGDLDLLRNREQLKSIRRGEWTEKEIKDYFSRKESELEALYQKSRLPYGPDESKIKSLLFHCLEEHYGSLDKCVVDVDSAVTALREVNSVLERHRDLL